jgi:2-amino-4-hydroxy-6-hydroxymethyldihydropteridine diphosphokinase
MPEVFVAAGSNFAPERHLNCAVAELKRAFAEVRCSPRYRSAAADGASGHFVNLVMGFSTTLAPLEVQETLKTIEARCGRSRTVPQRVEVDLDLLLYGDLVCTGEALTLPRPELLIRSYMLGPLADLAPNTRHPTAKLSIAELWQRFDQSRHPLEPLPD